jgi:hypothetical protein
MNAIRKVYILQAVPECTLTELVLKMTCFKAVGFCSGALIGGILSDM